MQSWRAAGDAVAADSDDRRYRYGLLLYAFGDAASRAQAEHWLRRAAANAHIAAQYSLGVLLHERGTQAQIAEAAQWWRAAAQAGDPDAQHSLAALLDDRGTAASTTEATRWREAAAGLTSVQRHLGALSDRRARVGASDAPAGTQSAAAAKQRGADRQWMSRA